MKALHPSDGGPSARHKTTWKERQAEEQDFQATAISGALKADPKVEAAIKAILRDKTVMASVRSAIASQSNSGTAANRDYGLWFSSLSSADASDIMIWTAAERLGSKRRFPGMSRPVSSTVLS